jgi:signal transduction histidine kinase
VATRCHDLQKLAQTALTEVRRIARGLRPSLLDDLGLLAAIEKVVRDFSEHTPVKITLHAPTLVGIRLPDLVETAVFRIFQEALTNAIRHAEARSIIIGLEHQTRQITLTVSDDGHGFDPVLKTEMALDGGHMGLGGIRERVALLGGQFSLDTAPGQGCRITVTLPTEGKFHE